MNRDEELMSALIAERGYLVMATYVDYKVGQVVHDLARGAPGSGQLQSEQKFYVISETTRADMMEQCEVILRLNPIYIIQEIPNVRFYRIGTD